MKQFFQAAVMAMVLISLLVAPASAAKPVTEPYDVIEFGADFDPPVPSGFPPSSSATASLKRHSDKVHIKITTDGLEPGGVYTIWAIVWNDTSQCADPSSCGPDDIGPDVPGNAIFWVTGKVINSNGSAVFNKVIHEGPPAGDHVFLDGDDNGLANAAGAEIHFVIRAHGQPIPGLVNEQKTTLNGGCVGPCPDHQAAIPQ